MNCRTNFILEGNNGLATPFYTDCKTGINTLKKAPITNKVPFARIFWGQLPILSCKDIDIKQLEFTLVCLDENSHLDPEKILDLFSNVVIEGKCTKL